MSPAVIVKQGEVPGMIEKALQRMETKAVAKDGDTIDDRARAGREAAAQLRTATRAAWALAARISRGVMSVYERRVWLDLDQLADLNRSMAAGCAQNGQYSKAIGLLEKALAVRPGELELHEQLGYALYADGRHEEARAHLSIVAQRGKDLG